MRPRLLDGSRVRVAAAISAIAILSSVALPAHAEQPVDLGGEYVLDRVDALGDRRAEVLDSLDELSADTDLQLFVVYVEEFDGVTDGAGWADETASINGLGDADVLLAVATGDRAYGLSVALDAPISDAQLAELESVAIEPALQSNDWAGAAIGAADGLAAIERGDAVPAPDIQPGEADPQPPFNPVPVILLGLVLLAGVIALAVWLARRSAAARAVEQKAAAEREELERRAGSLLVQLDDEVRTSDDELGFALAQFGADAVAPFSAAVAAARAKVGEAFALRQKLDDAEPESDADRGAILARVIELCEAADAELDSQADAFDALRDLEQNAERELATLDGDLAALRPRAESAGSRLTVIETEFGATAMDPVEGNAEQSRRLVEVAATASTGARERLAASARGEAALAIRAGRAALVQVTQLLDAIDAREGDLRSAAEALPGAVAETRADLAAAAALPADPAVAAAVAGAEEALAAAAATRDPIAAVQQVQAADARLDTVLVAARTAAEQRARTERELQLALRTAEGQVTSADTYISTRRGTVGEAARMRVAEARRNLAEAGALGATDPAAALRAAQLAASQANRALDLARSDVGVRTSSPFDDDGYGGAEIGGLLGYLLGGDSDGWSGSSGSGWSSGWSSGRSRSGGFGGFSGGFGGSSRRSSGGGFGGGRRSSGGGGRRSRGGRF